METTYDNAIEQIAQSIYSTMLNIDLARAEEPMSSDKESLLAAIQIAGEWTGSVVLDLSPEVARESAAAMLQLSSQGVSDADLKDVAAELVNMIGGNLKSILPGPSFLSLPTVVSGHEFGLEVHDAQLMDDVVLRSASGSLRVRLYVRVPTAIAAC